MRSFFWLVVLIFIMGACTPIPTQLPTPAEITPTKEVTVTPLPLPKPDCPFETLLPATAISEITRITGNEAITGKPFQLKEKSVLRVHWVQSSRSDFFLAINNTDPAQENTSYGKVTFSISVGPSASCGDYEFIPGEYQILVEKADGPWEIWIETIKYNN